MENYVKKLEKQIKSLFAGVRFIKSQNTKGYCWIRGNDSTVYTSIKIDNKSIRAHRVSYELFTGIRLTYNGCHHCDTPACINYEHVFDGTHKNNRDDAIKKNRMLDLYQLNVLRKQIKINEAAGNLIRLDEVSGIDKIWEDNTNEFSDEELEIV